jgi:hypothetical protein
MKVIRGRPTTGNPPKIICSGCGRRAEEAGIAVPESAAEQGYSVGPGVDGPVTMVEEDDRMQPLCEDCLAALLPNKR